MTQTSRCCLGLGVLLCFTILGFAEARDVTLKDSVLRLFSEEEQCGPKLSIETPACKVEKKGDGFELRRYPAGQIWAEALMADQSYNQAIYSGFYACFNFISGKNSENAKIEMTGPVLIKPDAEAKGWRISFFTPSEFKTVGDVPTPKDPRVKIVSTKEMLVAVSDNLGGFPREKEYAAKWLELKKKLDSAELKYYESSLVYAGYSSPFEVFNRKQEVHVTIIET